MLMCRHAFGMEHRDGLERDCKIAAGNGRWSVLCASPLQLVVGYHLIKMICLELQPFEFLLRAPLGLGVVIGPDCRQRLLEECSPA